ncbi:hypothetical protein [Tardiphaga sp.]|uniref:hypothetical protein n=1 Tax=Tardiphaga sp. TaxID=1926292 RepID=UPI002612B715|nr:hypothetical protein [Tardiphaga sp.]MDB5616586.1 hypothetical protein [Tardiphaga sp.]
MPNIHTGIRADIASSRRVRYLQDRAYVLRQHAINAGCDLVGWRLARKMRDVTYLNQVDAIERELGSYLRTHRVELSNVA